MKKKIISLLLITMIYISLTPASATPEYREYRALMTSKAISNQPAALKYGIDVSRWQGDIDWEAVSETRADFVILRAAVGAVDDEPISIDSRFREYIKGAQEHQLEVGVYFYSYAKTVTEIRKEARFLVNLLSEFEITYPVALDMEEEHKHYKDDPGEMAEAFLEIIMDAGYFPMLYSYKSWLEGYLIRETCREVTIWVAQLDSPSTTYGGNYYMWQYSHTGSVSGIEGDVDLNIAFRDFGEYIRRVGLNNL